MIDSPLFVAAWSPSDFQGGTQAIRVEAVDAIGSQFVVQEFSVDKTPADIPHSSARLLQNFPGHVFAQVTFSLLYIYTFGIMLLLPAIIPLVKRMRGHPYRETSRLSDEVQ